MQFVELASLTLTKAYVNMPAVPVGTDTLTLFPEVVVIVWLLPLLTVYVKVYGAVPEPPVKVIFGEVPSLQTEVVPEIVAVGNGFTVIVALPVCAWEQVVELASLTLKRL